MHKLRFIALFSFLTAFLSVAPAYAVTAGAQFVRLSYASTNVTASAYTQLVAQTTRGIKAVSVYNSSGNPIKLAFGGAGAEVDQMVVPAATAVVPVVYPLTGGYGLRLSVEAINGTNSTGELELNLFYN